jgi:hypothetical protein
VNIYVILAALALGAIVLSFVPQSGWDVLHKIGSTLLAIDVLAYLLR